MIYYLVHWLHSFPDEPVTLYFELDENRWEVRKVERYSDHTLKWADAEHEDDSIHLSTVPHPIVEEIIQDPQFVAEELASEEFERVWIEAQASI